MLWANLFTCIPSFAISICLRNFIAALLGCLVLTKIFVHVVSIVSELAMALKTNVSVDSAFVLFVCFSGEAEVVVL